MDYNRFWNFVFLGCHFLTFLGLVLIISDEKGMKVSQSGAQISKEQIELQIANKTLYLDKYNWIVSSNPTINIVDNQSIEGINIVFYEINDKQSISLKDAKFNATEEDKEKGYLTVKMKGFCKSYAEKVKGRMIITKTSVIDSKVYE